MQRLINYYPHVIKRIKDIQEIAKAEDMEFSKLRIKMAEIEGNMFIFTANEEGVCRYEKFLGIVPKRGQRLDDRKLYILSSIFRRKLSLSELMRLLNNYAEVSLSIDKTVGALTVKVGDNVSNVGTIYEILDEYMPLNVYMAFETETDALIRFCETNKILEMETTIYVRGYVAGAWFLDGSVLLDGSRLLNAVTWQQIIRMEMETSTQIIEKGSGAELIRQKNAWFLDGSVLLDGNRILNAEFYEEVLEMAEITTVAAKKKILLARAGMGVVAPIKEMAFGDGGVDNNGNVIQPQNEQKELNNEICRKKITKIEIISDTQVKYYCDLDEDELAGRGISELALVDADGDMVTIKNFATKEKDRDFLFTFKVNDTM
ncbi:MAG: phage tail protein [Roseburia sp.]|nr:phage tail protein [Roseburia sp.]